MARIYRLVVVAGIVCLIHHHRARLAIDGDAPIKTEEVRPFFAGAARLEADDSDRLGLYVLDTHGARLGYVLRTAPVSNRITGYAGPTDTLVAIGPDMRVIGIRVRSSADTKEHVRDVATDDYFLKTWNGKTWDEVAGLEPRAAGIEGVSGASLTSLCIANGIQHRFQYSRQMSAALPRPRVRMADVGLLLAIGAALVFAFTHLRSRLWLRHLFQVVLIGYVGLWNGQLLSQSLLAGWAAGGLPWRLAPGLVLLTAAALIVPWASRRALYCSHICPYGAAQELLGRMTRRRLKLRAGFPAGLRWLPAGLVALVLFVTMLNVPLDLAAIEPFDAYLIRTAGIATIAIAIGGLLASTVVPMAYCKYGCPTGLVLSFVRSHGRADGFSRRDLAAGLMVLFVAVLYWRYGAIHRWLLG